MSEQYHIVPWFNSEEWHTVYHYLYSEPTNKLGALELLQTWKARCPALPSGIESTLCLLQVQLQDEKDNNDLANDQIVRLAYSSAIMRFVNHMLDPETAKGTSLYNAAKLAGVPDWIVDLRHDTAHNNILPSVTLLRNACLISLEWLQRNYWDKHKKCINDYTLGQKEPTSNNENKLAALMHFCTCLSICSHSKIKKLSDITDPSMQEAIVYDARDLFGDLIDLSNLKTVSTASLINMINVHAKKILLSCNTTYVSKALVGEESLFLSLELLEYLSRNDFNNKRKLSKSYVKCFEVMLSFLHTNDLIFDLVMSLIEMTQSEECSRKSLLAALWTSEILSALRKSKQFIERANKMQAAGANKRKDLKVLYHHWFPNERLDGLILDLQNPVPSKLTDINIILPIVSSYNPYLTFFVRDLLYLVDPHLPKQVCDKICKLAQLISTPEKFPVQPSAEKIYTVDDLKPEDNFTGNDSEMRDIVGDASLSFTQEQHISGIWKLATKHNWGLCPIGKIPWESQNVDVAME